MAEPSELIPGDARRVLVFDPNPLMRDLLVLSLRSHNFIAEAAATPEIAWSELVALDPDAVVMEVNINSCESGVSFAEAMLEHSPGLGVVFVTDVAHSRVVDPQRTKIPSGAAYLNKSALSGVNEIVDALEAVLRESADVPRHDLRDGAKWAELSSKQIDVLRLIAEGRSNKDIAQLRGTQVRSVEALIGRTFDQLGIDELGPEGNRRVAAARHYLAACGAGVSLQAMSSV